MRLFKRSGNGDTAVADPLADLPESPEEQLAEIERLAAANRARPDRATERRLLRLRHLAGIGMLGTGGRRPYPEPDTAALPVVDGLPEISPSELTPELLRAGILRDGCLLVRGLVEREVALELASGIDRAFEDRSRAAAGKTPRDGYYEEFEPEPPFNVAAVRPWIEQGGGVLAGDSPRLATRMLELFEDAGLPRLVQGYLGESPLVSVHKTTLRKADPSVSGAWHQDGAFMGDARALNLWLSLSRCGDLAPGLDLVPRRLDEIVIEHDAMLDVELTRARAQEAAGDVPIVRPIFEPGDALFFDEMFLHQTGSDPSMPNPRFAIESWFFGGSAFPAGYAPIAV
jgi:hypothetical protein